MSPRPVPAGLVRDGVLVAPVVVVLDGVLVVPVVVLDAVVVSDTNSALPACTEVLASLLEPLEPVEPLEPLEADVVPSSSAVS